MLYLQVGCMIADRVSSHPVLLLQLQLQQQLLLLLMCDVYSWRRYVLDTTALLWARAGSWMK